MARSKQSLRPLSPMTYLRAALLFLRGMLPLPPGRCAPPPGAFAPPLLRGALGLGWVELPNIAPFVRGYGLIS
eukprot:254170-Alexandrium_andersonii.AAC.1